MVMTHQLNIDRCLEKDLISNLVITINLTGLASVLGYYAILISINKMCVWGGGLFVLSDGQWPANNKHTGKMNAFQQE